MAKKPAPSNPASVGGVGTLHIILVFMAMLLVALISQPIAERLHLPFSAVLVLVGFICSEIITGAGLDLGLRWQHFHDVVLFVLLPVLIFESALSLDVRLLLKNLAATLILAIPLMLLSAGLTAVLVYYGIAHPSGFPWIAALLTGALLSATDPAAVIGLFRKAGVPDRLAILLDGESLFNDAAAIVLYALILEFALDDSVAITMGAAISKFLITFFGGLLVGAVVGGIGALALRLVTGRVLQGVVSLISAYAAFLLADELFRVSGVMSVLATGLAIGWACRNVRSAMTNTFMGELWEFNAYIANATIFLLVGITITLEMFREQWLAMLIGIAAVLVARAVGIFGVIAPVSRLPGIGRIDLSYQLVMFWGGVRGAVALALALSLPLDLSYWYTVQSIAYGVVLFTLFVQAPTMPILLKVVKL